MTRLEALVGLNLTFDIGTIRLNKLLEYFATPENILNAPRERLSAVYGIGQNISNGIKSIGQKDIDKEFEAALKLGINIIAHDDVEYPLGLKNIPDPPIVLYVKGELKPQDNISIAIVGSRRASYYGLSSAEQFARELSAKGLTIVSGMARGIDTYAHKGALKQRGRTIAVMGSGFNHIYPEENKQLAQDITRHGAVISEFPIDVGPLRQNFPRRNRVISGLSLGTLVVEAARNSGALITADFALEQGREVFALPGKIDCGTSFGTNALIKQGAKLVSCADDIIEELNIGVQKYAQEKVTQGVSVVGLAGQEAVLYEAIASHPVDLDEIIEKTRLDIGSISSMLLTLQMKRFVKQLPGKRFIKSEVK